MGVIGFIILIGLGVFFAYKDFNKDKEDGIVAIEASEGGDFELAEGAVLSDFITNVGDVTKVKFEKDNMTIEKNEDGTDYNISAYEASTDTLNITYNDDSVKRINITCVDTYIHLNIDETINLNEVIDDINNVKSVKFVNDNFSINENIISVITSDIDTLEIEYNDGTTEEKKFICDDILIKLEPGSNYNLKEYITDTTEIKDLSITDNSIITVDDFVITAIMEGKTVITVTYNDDNISRYQVIVETETSNVIVDDSGNSVCKYYARITKIETEKQNDKTRLIIHKKITYSNCKTMETKIYTPWKSNQNEDTKVETKKGSTKKSSSSSSTKKSSSSSSTKKSSSSSSTKTSISSLKTYDDCKNLSKNKGYKWKKGSSGTCVTIFQTALYNWYLEDKTNRTVCQISRDGIFGTKTYDCVKAFQTAQNITVDGIVGNQTWTKLEPYKDGIPSK